MSFAETFKALSDPARREILLLLRGGCILAAVIICIVRLYDKRLRALQAMAITAAVLYAALNLINIDAMIAQSVLKKADLVFETREKNFIYYELNTSVVEEVMLWLSQLKGDNHESHS